MSADVYADYDGWKGWSFADFPRLTEHDRRYFRGELGGIALAGAEVLEIGFGEGAFLAFAREAGARIAGTELLAEAVAAARAAGVELLDTDLARNLPAQAGRFDLIVAFDVIEHLTFEELDAALAAIAALLKPGGRFLARFPNGESPLGRVNQHGDISHRITLSRSALRQILRRHPLEIERAANQFLTPHGSNPVERAMIRFRHKLQYAVERIVNWIFEADFLMGFNLVVVLRRR